MFGDATQFLVGVESLLRIIAYTVAIVWFLVCTGGILYLMSRVVSGGNPHIPRR